MTRPRITRNPEVMGGMPCIDGTRWPTETVVEWEFDRAAILRAYPGCLPEHVDCAIRYERSRRRRLGRLIWRIRYRVAAWLIDIDAGALRDTVG